MIKTFVKMLISGLLVIGVITALMFGCCEDVDGQDYTGPLDDEYDADQIQRKFDIFWNFVRGLNVADGGVFAFDSGVYDDTLITNIVFDSIKSVVIQSREIVRDGAVIHCNPFTVRVISDTSFSIHRVYISDDDGPVYDTVTWIAVGRIKLNW